MHPKPRRWSRRWQALSFAKICPLYMNLPINFQPNKTKTPPAKWIAVNIEKTKFKYVPCKNLICPFAWEIMEIHLPLRHSRIANFSRLLSVSSLRRIDTREYYPFGKACRLISCWFHLALFSWTLVLYYFSLQKSIGFDNFLEVFYCFLG